MNSVNNNQVITLMNQLFLHDIETFKHSFRVGMLMHDFAQYRGSTPMESQYMYVIGVLHDIGKLGISSQILTKPGNLTLEEYEVVKQHPLIGAKKLFDFGYPVYLCKQILYHHENYDGTGYYGKKKYELSYECMLLRIIDSYDALNNGRIYQQSYSIEEIMKEFSNCRGSLYHPKIIDELLPFLEKHHLQSG